MEGINTADALLSKNFPVADLDQKMKKKEERARIAIQKLKMDRLECLNEPLSPISLIIDYSKKI
ncbi:hypothetical protein [Fluviicola chungangensis]|uniref:Uncharacterized protein n=1 Tax=Fluviicola chungangensis TaxID=2597671 RepID=A0A556N3T5_9FLAO|nr:hypothetical protein [Fluviicola chungangensis]TSJ46719.1 hypothetical protein FO442_06040 [Fluviicola chungangensis]